METTSTNSPRKFSSYPQIAAQRLTVAIKKFGIIPSVLIYITLCGKGDFNYLKTGRKVTNKVPVFGRLLLPENRMKTGMLTNPEARLTDFSPVLP